MIFFKIRKNKPEELVRVALQMFSAYPKQMFLKYCIEKSWNNINTLEVKSDYDVLYMGANAMVSEAYHEYINRDSIELIYDTNNYIRFSSKGSWRMPYSFWNPEKVLYF